LEVLDILAVDTGCQEKAFAVESTTQPQLLQGEGWLSERKLVWRRRN